MVDRSIDCRSTWPSGASGRDRRDLPGKDQSYSDWRTARTWFAGQYGSVLHLFTQNWKDRCGPKLRIEYSTRRTSASRSRTKGSSPIARLQKDGDQRRSTEGRFRGGNQYFGRLLR